VLYAWTILPDAALTAIGGSLHEPFVRAGCATFRDAAKHVRELPYGRNSDRADWRLVLDEGRGTCSTKHALLAALARELGLLVVLVIGIFDMNEANTPGVGGVLSAHALTSLPEAHCYLLWTGRRIDVTRAGPGPVVPISRFDREWEIDPSQIGQDKVRLHRAYLAQWLARHPDPRLSLNALWRIREECIAALGTRR
jgi:hypothetical protein